MIHSAAAQSDCCSRAVEKVAFTHSVGCGGDELPAAETQHRTPQLYA
eukprot:COSAG05_NODE_13339_length_434_cov_0.620896_2_plen_46_part_01